MSKHSLFTEQIPPHERHEIQSVETTVVRRMESLYGRQKLKLRDTHTKSHGCVAGQLEIFGFDQVPIKQLLQDNYGLESALLDGMNLKTGLFERPGVYRTTIRFANGAPRIASDQALDTRSMSIKVHNVAGDRLDAAYDDQAMDIIVQNAEIFFVKTIKDYHSFFKAAGGATWKLIWWLITHPLQAWALMKTVRRKPVSLLTESYWSGSAFALGVACRSDHADGMEAVSYPAAVKYGFFPVDGTSEDRQQSGDRIPRDVPADFYHRDLNSRLSKSAASYSWDFKIQIQTRPKQSIEDVTDAWHEDEAPFHTVGRLTIDTQKVVSPQDPADCERLSFSPWNAPKVHRPIGQLNRLRGYIYPIVKKLRQGGSAQ